MCYYFSRIPDIGRLVPFSSVGNRGELGGVCLQYYFSDDCLPDDFRQPGVFKCNDSIYPDFEIIKFFNLFQFGFITGKTMKDSGERVGSYLI